MTDTANLGLPCIDAAQAQKHVTHNEALRLLDTLVQLAVLDRDLTAPPGSPSEGQRWIVASSPTGAWAGHATHVAAWQDGGWQFSVPQTGWIAYVVDEGALVTWNGSAWGDFFSTVTAIQNLALLGVGTTADSTNPFSAKLNNALWAAKTVAESGTGDLRYKLSKASAANTLSFVLQDNFSGRAEIGLAGDDDFHFKVSPDGSTWNEALTISASTGGIRFLAAETDLASAATCDLGSAASLEIRITGTTAVTSFGTAANCVRLLRFAGVLTLTHNATSLVLPTGANIVTAAGDCAVAASDGSGNWRVRHYQRADGTPLALAANQVTAVNLAALLGYGLPMVNRTLAESHAGNAVTYAVKTMAGADPSASDPVDFYFRDAAAAAGDYGRRRVTAALSVTVAAGATLGAQNGTAFRAWLLAVDTGAGVALGVVNCLVGGSAPSAIFPLNEDQLVSPTATPGSSAGVIYTAAGQTTKPFRKIGFAEYGAGLAAAGTWNAAPSKLALFGPGVKSPGEGVQTVQGTTSTTSSTTSSSYQNTALSAAIAPTSAANPVRVSWVASLDVAAGANGGRLAMHRGATLVGTSLQLYANDQRAQISLTNPPFLDNPATTASTAYTLEMKSGGLGGTVAFVTIDGNDVAQMLLEEIMA